MQYFDKRLQCRCEKVRLNLVILKLKLFSLLFLFLFYTLLSGSSGILLFCEADRVLFEYAKRIKMMEILKSENQVRTCWCFDFN